MKRIRWKSILSVLDPALVINETASSHLSLLFFFLPLSFRPSWSTSTPAYGTLLPWGRTMRRPFPVSPVFSSPLFSLCFSLQVEAHSQASALSLPPSLTASTYLLFPFILLKRRMIFILSPKGRALSCGTQPLTRLVYWRGACIQRNTKGF